MPTLNGLYDQLSTVIAEYDDCVLTCSIPFARRRRRPKTPNADAEAAFELRNAIDIGSFKSPVNARTVGRRRQPNVAAAPLSDSLLLLPPPQAVAAGDVVQPDRRSRRKSDDSSSPNSALSVLALTLFGSRQMRCVDSDGGC